MFTPWGAPVRRLRLEPGITAVLTARHGGLMLARGYAERCLSAPARRRAVRFGEYYAFEIDHAWAVAMLELPHLWEAFATFAKPELRHAPMAFLRGILATHDPEYLIEIEAPLASMPSAAAATHALTTES